MIALDERDLRDNGRASSKGNQFKWEKDGTWYKADYTGYEGLSEYVISHLLMHSSLRPEEYIVYDFEQIQYRQQIFCGCKSRDFAGDSQIITLERLISNLYGISLYAALHRIKSTEARLSFLVEQVERATGISGFGVYMEKLMAVDAVFLNEDRHTHNISVLINPDGKYGLCPIYDNGAGLLSDTSLDYPLGEDIYRLIPAVKAKPICEDFEEQLSAAESLYGNNITFSFDYNDVYNLLEKADIYDRRIRERVETIIMEQRRKFSYLFHS